MVSAEMLSGEATVAEQRPLVRKVETIRQRLTRRDGHLIDLYLQEGGNCSAVVRRLRRGREDMQGRYSRLFLSIKVTA